MRETDFVRETNNITYNMSYIITLLAEKSFEDNSFSSFSRTHSNNVKSSSDLISAN